MGAGSVSESFVFPSVSGRGQPLALSLRYSTTNDTPAVIARVPFTITSQIPRRATWRIEFQGQVYSGEGYEAEAMMDTRNALGERVAPGLYPFTAVETFYYDSGAQPSLRAQGSVEVRRGDIWPFGFGWMSSYDTLLVDRTDTVTAIQGDGQYLTYNRDANGRYVPAAEDFSTLVRFADGSWLRTSPQGVRQWFSPAGRLLKLEDRNGISHTLAYEPVADPPPAGVWGLGERLSAITDASGRSYQFRYGADGYIDRVTDPAGRIFTLTHNAAGDLTAVTDPLGRVTAYEYDANHLLTRIVYPKGDDVRLSYDGRRRVVNHTDALGGVRTAQYQTSRNTFTDERGVPTSYLFNSFAAVTQWRNPVQSVNYLWNDDRTLLGTDLPYRRLAYDARGNVVEDSSTVSLRWTYDSAFSQPLSFTDGARNTTRYAYDSRGNLVQTTDAAGNVYRAEYDSFGLLARAVDPLNQAVSFEYDAFGNPIRVTDALGSVHRMNYDARGNLTGATDVENHVTSFTYDVMDRVTAATNALGQVMRFDYDANDNLVKATDARGNATTLTYDALNRVTAATDPLNKTTQYEYDAVGNLLKVTDAQGGSASYGYDDGNRRLTETYNSGPGVTYAYNAANDLVSYEDGLTRATYVYTNAIPGKPEAVTTDLLAPGIASSVNYDYVIAAGSTASGATLQPDASARSEKASDLAAEGNPEPDAITDPAAGQSPGNPLPDPITSPSAPQDSEPTPRSVADPVRQPPVGADAGRPPGQDDRPAGRAYSARPTATATDVCGTISANTVWSLASSPYRVTCDISVNAGVTLTIAPGVVVKFNSYYDTLWVSGRLVADGDAGQPITFTSIKDDSAGGDTNGDGNATQPAPNDWDSLRILGSSTGNVLDNAIVRYGGGDWSENVYVATRDIALTNTTISFSAQEGIRFDNVLPVVFTGNTFLNNTGLPVWASLSGNSHSLAISGNTASGHAANGFAVAGSIGGDVTWDGDDGFPFVVWDDLVVSQGAKLTLTPGTVVKFRDYYDTLWVDGMLMAGGEASQPIIFTSIRDDAAGGDTNGDGSATGPAANDWDSLRLRGPGSVLDRAIVRYGGGDWSENVYVSTRDITLTNNIISFSAQEGIRFDNVLPATFTGNTFVDNTGAPVWAPLGANSHSLAISGNTASGHDANGFVVAGSIGGDVTWDGDDGFPFVVWDDLVVNQGATLTLTPGTVVKFRDYYDTLWVDGTLIADSEESQPITFTSLKDDTAGGNTDGKALLPAGNDWDSLRFRGTSTGSVLDNAIVRYGGGDWSENVYVATRDITLTNNTIAFGEGEGIRFDNVLPATMTGNTFVDNSGAPVWAPLSGNSHSLAISGNTASGHTANGFVVAGSIGGDVTWDGDDGFPFVVWDDLVINQGAKLTLTPGTVVKFRDYYDTLWVNGTLIADGDQSDPITFTSLQDDAAGGDTNGDSGATQPKANEWDSLRFQGSSTGSVLDYASVRFGGGDWSENVYVATGAIAIDNSAISYSNEHGIRFDGASPRLTGNTIAENAASGVYTQNGAQPILRQSRITGNKQYGIFNQDRSRTIDAEDNWWGSVKGPNDPSNEGGGLYNPNGDGDRVSDGVDYQPWLAFTGLLYGVTVSTGANPVQTLRLAYDELSRVTELGASGPVQTVYRYTYDAAGRLTASGSAAGSPGVRAAMEYDPNARLTRLINRNASGGVTFSDIRYTYDKVGNVLSAQEAAGTTTYTYDSAYQLTSVSGPGLSQTYAYDAAGNRTGKAGVTYSYDAANQLLTSSDGGTFTYDANGNLRTRTRAGQTTAYTWDVRDRLTRVDYPDGTFNAFAYDAQGRRISRRDRQGATSYFIYEGWNLMQEVAPNGAVLANYVYDGLDHPIAMNRGGTTYYYLYDRLGNVVGLTNGAGVLVASYRYDPWGNLLAAGGINPNLTNPFRFVGREWDADSGLYYMRGRYYDPDLGRFISRDPLRLTMPAGNHYAYAANNPANASDPMGLDVANRRWWQTLGGVVVGVGGGLIFLATAPVSGPLALAAGAAAAGGLAGGVAAGTSELFYYKECDFGFWSAVGAGVKGGVTGGALSPYVAYGVGSAASSVSAWSSGVGGSGLGGSVQSVAAQRFALETGISAAKRMMAQAVSKGDWLLYERWQTKLELLQAALGKLPIW